MFVVVFLVSCSLQFACAGGQINKSSQPPLVIVSLDGMDWRILKNHRFTPNLVTTQRKHASLIVTIKPLRWCCDFPVCK